MQKKIIPTPPLGRKLTGGESNSYNSCSGTWARSGAAPWSGWPEGCAWACARGWLWYADYHSDSAGKTAA